MPLQAGLYKSQDQQEQDLTDGPGWTIDDQKPGMFSGLAGAAPRGIGQGVADGISVLTHGLHEQVIPALMEGNPFASLLDGANDAAVKGLPGAQTAKDANEALETISAKTREYSKSLVGDPLTTGTAANVIQGFSKAATEFTLGSLAGGPESGAALLGATEGYAHYGDMLDAGVDEETAQKSGLTTAMLSGGAAFLPMAMPAKWLAGLTTPAALGAQAATGAAVNTGFGVADRYAQAKILRDAGYDTMADQQDVWDKANLLTDAISGAFFGAHSGWHGIKELDGAKIDPSVLDAAKVVQDRQAVIDAAPGMPVDAKSAAVNRHALEKSLSDLLTDKPVDLSEIDTAGAAFARGDVDQSAATKIIRDAFADSGVLDEGAADRWVTGEQEIEAVTPKPAKAAPVEPIEAAPAPKPGEDGEEPPQVSPAALAERPDLEIADEAGEPTSAAEALKDATDEEAQANKEADPMHQAAVACEARHA